ncbi:DUF4296 domain-containing protein [Sediminicola luteus]|uniref:DUF4296 domain-containing protein n=1 Tax=Sediminicola luteus TaxID=319238 RepID=A0A2A4G421_9FLAO|nr:DUF4296 domain-containing protein [Sediminicola luteus]PCE62714.1 hypothetical protein B7P33_15580 [Sediminicola luteus]
MRKLWVLLGVVLVATSCAEKTVEPPEDLIDAATMEEILYDLALLTAGKNTNILTLDKYKWEPTAFVFKKYGIDSVQFAQSDLYYAANPDIYEEIYTKIDERFGKIKDSLEDNRQIQAEKKREKLDTPKKNQEEKPEVQPK